MPTNHFIPLADAVTMTTTYRQQKENVLATAFRGQNILAICETFDRAAFDTVLAQNDCQGLRIYFGMDNSYKVHAIIVGVDSNDADMIPAKSSATDEQIIETGARCPSDCPPSSALNS
ncbi:MAG: hypothetical protein JWP69_1328 [Flaviaesturariibacter sp.]|nr:hypothetical protein [Flaviaesturariibacter sp.]